MRPLRFRVLLVLGCSSQGHLLFDSTRIRVVRFQVVKVWSFSYSEVLPTPYLPSVLTDLSKLDKYMTDGCFTCKLLEKMTILSLIPNYSAMPHCQYHLVL